MLIPAKERDRFRKKVYLERPPSNRWKMGPKGFLIPERLPFIWNLQIFAELDDGLFLVDGEDAGSTPWEFDSVANEAGNTFALDATNPNEGTNAYRASFGGSNESCYGRIDPASAQEDIYARVYIYISSGAQLGGAWQTCSLLHLNRANITSYKFRLGALSDGSSDIYNWTYITAGGTLNTSTGTNFSLGAWHLCELHWKAGDGSGGGEIWVDETELESDLTGTETQDVSIVMTGSHATDTPADLVTIDFDDLKADTSYIGPYAEGPAPPSGQPAIKRFGGIPHTTTYRRW